MNLRVLRSTVWAILMLGALGLPSGALAGEEGSPRVRGSVLDASGAPIVGARIELVPLQGVWLRDRESWRGRIRPEAVSHDETDEGGAFELVAEGPGYWRVLVEADGYLPVQNSLVPVLDDRVLGPVRLPRGERVSVKVVDPEGRPVEGAWVRAGWADYLGTSAESGVLDGWSATYRERSSDKKGRVRLARAPHEVLALSAWARGFVESPEENIAGSEAILRLAVGVERLLNVRRADGAAFGGVLIRAGEGRWPVALSAEDGSARVVVADREEATIELEAVGGAYTLTTLRKSEDRSEAVIVRLEPPTRLEGRVIEKQSGYPVAGAWVVLSGQYPRSVRTDGSGSFVLHGHLQQRGRLGVAALGYRKHADWVTLEKGGTTIALERTVTVRGVCRDEDGEVVGGVEIEARPRVDSREQMRYFFRDRAIRTRSDAGGLFELRMLRPDLVYRVVGSRVGYARSETEILDPGRTRARIEVVMVRGARVWGRTVDEEGRPVAGARIELEKKTDGSSFASLMVASSELRRSFSAESDARGVFVWEHLPLGRYGLSAELEGYAPALASSFEIAVEEGHDLGEIELPTGVELEGRVVDPDGRPLSEAVIRALDTSPGFTVSYGGSDTQGDSITDDHGRFVVRDRRRGEKLDLQVSKIGFADKRAPGIEVPVEGGIEIVLQPAQTISGLVVDPEGKGVANARVVAQDPSHSRPYVAPRSQAMTNADGRFELEDVSPGALRLEVNASGWQSDSLGDLEVLPGEDLEGLRIVLEKGFEIAGRVFHADGSPAAGVTVALGGATPKIVSRLMANRSDASGAYLLTGVAPGPTTVVAGREDGVTVAGEVDVQADLEGFDLRFSPGYEVSGRLISEDGGDSTGALVYLGTGKTWGARMETRADAQGRFRFEAVPSGSYRLGADHPNYAESVASELLEVAEAPVSGVTLELGHGGRIGGRLVGIDAVGLATIEISAFNAENQGLRFGRVEGDARYVIEKVPPGTWSIWAATGSAGAEKEVTLAVGEERLSEDLDFADELTVSGLVARGEEPLSGARVLLQGLDVSGGSSGRTDHRGRFEIGVDRPGRYRLEISRMPTGLLHREEISVDSDRELAIQVETFEVAGRVLDGTDRAPVSGAVVRWRPDEETSSSAYTRGASATTGSDGSFRIVDIPVGEHRLLAEKDGYAALDLELRGPVSGDLELELRPTQGVRLEVSLPSGARVQWVETTVLGADGRPLSRRKVVAIAGGRIRLGSVPPGSWRILLQSSGSGVTALEIQAPSDLIAVRLERGTNLEVVVGPIDGDLTTLAQVRLVGRDGRAFVDLSGKDHWPAHGGSIRIEHVPSGSWRAVADSPDGRHWSGEIDLSGEPSRRVELR